MKKKLLIFLSATIYQIVTTLIIPFALIRLYIKAKKNPDYAKRIPERFCILPNNVKQSHDIWIHTVSVGEFIACLPLIKELIANNHQLLVTTTTPTGSKLVQSKLGKTVSHCFIPWDNYLLSYFFIKRTQPKLAVFMETEIWPNLLSILYKKNIPSLLINARLSKKSLNKYKKVSSFSSHIFNQFTHIACQDEQSAQNFSQLSNNAIVLGNLKFDITLPEQFDSKLHNVKQLFLGCNYLLAASTHEEEEAIIINNFLKHDTEHFSHLVIAPRHPERAHKIAFLAKKHHLKYSFFSHIKKNNANKFPISNQLLIIDTIGDLLPFYALSELVFIGGSLINHGGHNPLEPAYFSKPCLIGMHYFNFQQLIDNMLNQQAIKTCTKQSLCHIGFKKQLISNQQLGHNAKQFLKNNQGATLRYASLIDKINQKRDKQ